MIRSKLSQALLSGVLAWVASSSAMARPLEFEPHNDDTAGMRIDKAALHPAVDQAQFAVSGALLRHGDKPRIGASPDGLPIGSIGGVISRDNHTARIGAVHHGFDIGDFSGRAWRPNARASVVHESPGHAPAGVADGANAFDADFARVREHGASTAAAVPEPSTYALLMVGLAGIALWQHRFRGSISRRA